MSNSSFLTVNIVGDFYASQKAIEFSKKNGYESVFNDLIENLLSKDLSLINLESPLTNHLSPIIKSGPNLVTSPQVIEILKYGGFDIACLANNHILDQGGEGLKDTIKLCEENGIRCVGAGSDILEASKLLVVEVKGIRIGILNIAENEFSIAGKIHPGANPLDIIENVNVIRHSKSKCDYLLMVYHGGVEHYHLPTPRMVKTLRFFIDSGVDAVVCHHSHFPTGYEVYNRKPIFYGIGNFFFDLPAPTSQWNLGLMVTLKIDTESLTTKFEITPFSQNSTSFGINRLNKVDQQNFLSEINKLSAIIINEVELISNWDNFLSENSLRIAASVFPFIPLKRKVLRSKKFPRVMQMKILGMLNTNRCESLREFYLGSLEAFLRSKD